MTSRARAVQHIAAAMFRWEPNVGTSTGHIVASSALPGEAAVKKIECVTCEGLGIARVRGIRTRCPDCDGTGHRMVDPVTLRRPLSEDDKTQRGPMSAEERTLWLAWLDSQIDHLDQGDGELNEVEAAANAAFTRKRSPFEQATRNALDRLRIDQPQAYGLIARYSRTDLAADWRCEIVYELVAAWASSPEKRLRPLRHRTGSSTFALGDVRPEPR